MLLRADASPDVHTVKFKRLTVNTSFSPLNGSNGEERVNSKPPQVGFY